MAYFNGVNKIQYEGAGSKNPFAFKYYNPEEKVNGKSMEEILRFGVAIGIRSLPMVQILLEWEQ